MELTVAFTGDCPPLSVIAAARVSGVSLSVDPSLPSGSPLPQFQENLQGNNALLCYIGKAGNLPNFYGVDALESGQIEEWIEFSSTFMSGSEFENACLHVDGHLTLRTLLVGSSLTIADLSIWCALAGTGQRWESIRKSNKYLHLARWYNCILAEHEDALNEVTTAYVGKRGLGKVPANGGKKEPNATSTSKDNGSSFEVDLPCAKLGEVCLRFAPEPSGYLHIGHSKAALLNKYFAEKYQGRLIIRFDDTNPSKESTEFVDNLLKDIMTLDIEFERVTYISSYFDDLVKMAEKLIMEGKAYVDDTPR